MPDAAGLFDAVKREICFASPLNPPVSALQDSDLLEARWRLFSPQREALAAPFQAIARTTKADATVSRGECDALATVGDAVKFVARKAGVALAG